MSGKNIYLFFSLIFFQTLLLAQSPGGVNTGLKAWYKADGNVVESSNVVSAWNNEISGGINLGQVKGNPTYLLNGLNFNPTVVFNGVDFLASNSGVLGSSFFNSSNNTMFVVFTNQLPSNQSGLIGKWEGATKTIGNSVAFEINNSGYLNYSFPQVGTGGTFGNSGVNGTKTSSTQMNQYSFLTSTVTNGTLDTLLINGLPEAVQASTTLDPTEGGMMQLGGNYVNATNGFNGQIAEIILFNTHLSFTERRKIESYLALKYGISLGNTSTPITYFASDNVTKPWSESTVYQNNIAGIGRDDASGLNQKQGTSVDINSLVTISLGSLQVSNSNNSNTFSTDKSFLLWGDNNMPLSSSGVNDLPPSIASRIARVWQTQETGNVGAVKFRYSLKGTTLGTSCIDYSSIRLLVDKDAVFSTGSKIVQPTSYDSIAQTIDFDVDFNATDGYYFTLGSTQAIGSPVVNNLSKCLNDTESPLTAIGNNLKWYTSASGGSGSATAPIPSTASVGTTSYWVSQSFGSCESTRSRIDVLVKPIPNVTASDEVICSGNTSNIALSSNIANSTFSWVSPTQTNANGGSASSGSPTANSQKLNSTTFTTGTVEYQVRATANLCIGPATTVTITVNPRPTVSIPNLDTTICSGSTTAIKLVSNVSGTDFSWSNPVQTHVTGVAASVGTPTEIAQTLLATSNVSGTVVYNVVASAKNCAGSSKNITVTVNPKPVITANDTTICSSNTTNILLKSNVANTSFSWSNPTQTLVSGASSGNQSSIAQTLNSTSSNSGTVSYSVVGVAQNCVGAAKIVTVTVNPLPVVSASNQTICSGNSTNVLLTSNVSNSSFSWQTPLQNLATGASASSGNPTNIIQTLNTTSNAQGLVKYAVVAQANNCVGPTDTVVVSVNPRPVVSANDTSICSGSQLAIALKSNVSGTTFSWVSPSEQNATGGTSSSGSPSVISNVINATSNVTGKVTYAVVGTANSCIGTAKNVTVNVFPRPTVVANDITICSGSNTNLALSSNVSGATFSWSNPVQTNVIGGGASTGNTISQILNSTNSGVVGNAIYNITATANSCSGSSKQVSVTVNPNPVITAKDTTVCSGAPFSVKLKSNIGGTSFSWNTPIQNKVSGASSSTGNPIVISQNLISTDTVSGFAQYKVIANANSCIDSSVTVKVTIKPKPIVSANDTAICTGNSIHIKLKSNISNTSFAWTSSSQSNISGSNSGTGSMISQVLSLNNNIQGTASYSVTPTLNSCSGSIKNVVVTVNPLPIISITANNDTVCKGDNVTLTASGASSYQWDNGVVNNTPFVINSTNTFSVIGIDNNGCSNSKTKKIVVNNLPNLDATAIPSSICVGGSTTLKGSGAVTYSWDNGVTNNVAFSPNSTKTYTVIGKDANGCENSKSIEVEVTANVPPNITAISTSDSFCVGGSTTLIASGGDTYVWDNGVVDNVSFTPDSTRKYTVVGTSANGCKGAAYVTVTVFQKPIIVPIANKDSICFGDSLKLSGSGAVNYSWNQGITDNVYFSPNSTLTYQVEGVDEFGCKGIASKSIKVNDLPAVSVSALRDSVCSGGFTKLSGLGAKTYSWNKGVQNNVLFSPVATDTYLVTGTDNKGCSDTASYTIVVTPNIPPVISINASVDSVCRGSQVSLIASGADDYVWDNGLVNGVSFTPDSTKTYTVIGTTNAGCNNIATKQIIVHQSPIISVVYAKDSICKGDTITLKGNGAQTYTWDNGVVDNVPFVLNNSKTFSVSGTDKFGCIGDTNVFVYVNQLPVVDAIVSKNTVCKGDSVVFEGIGANSYLWNKGVSNLKYFTPVSTDSYTLIGIDGNGCKGIDTVSVKVLSLPNVSASATNDSVCASGSTILTGSGAKTYFWSQNVVDGVAFNPNFTQEYEVIGTDSLGCSNSDKITVYVTSNIPPKIIATASKDSLCAGDSLKFVGQGGIKYVWNNNVIDNHFFTPISTGYFTVKGIDNRACYAFDSVLVKVNHLPILSITSSSDSLCLGDSLNLKAIGAVSYSWNLGVTDNVSFVPNQSETYQVLGTDAKGCVGKSQIQIVVNELPQVKAVASKNKICKNDQVFVNGTGAETYVWDNGVTNNTLFYPQSTVLYKVIGTDMFGCKAQDSVLIHVDTLPLVKANVTQNKICIGKGVTFSGSGADSYIWNRQVVNNVEFLPLETSFFTVLGTDVNGCKGKDSVEVVVDTLPLAPQVQDVSICKNSLNVPDLNTKVQGQNVNWYAGLINGNPIAVPVIDNKVASSKSYFVTQTNVNGCESAPRTQINVTVKELPNAQILASQSSYCIGKEKGLLLKAQTIQDASYQWYFNDVLQPTTTDTYSDAQAGNWELIVTVNSCADTSSQFVVTEKASPKSEILPTALAYCQGVNNITLFAKDSSNGVTYQWLKGNNIEGSNHQIKNVSAGDWYLVSTQNGCNDTSTVVSITENPLPIAEIITHTDSLSYFTGKKGIILKAANAGLGAEYYWYKNGLLYASTTVDSIENVKAGMYSLVVNKNSCSNSVSANTQVVEKNLNPFALNDTLVMDYLSVKTLQVTQNDYDPDGIIANNTVDLKLNLIGLQQTIIMKDTGVVFVDQQGFLTFTSDVKFTGTLVVNYNVKDDFGNTSNTAQIVISVGPHIFNDYQVVTVNTESVIPILENDISTNGFDLVSIDLDPSTAGIQNVLTKDGLGMFAVQNDKTILFVPQKDVENTDSIFYQLKDLKGGKSNIASITVKVRLLGVIIPNGFSPNGDGNHDVLAIYNPAGHHINVTIYNRWGNVVYEKTNYKDEFEGKSNVLGNVLGDELPDGTYYGTYEIQRIDGTKEKIIQSLLIKR